MGGADSASYCGPHMLRESVIPDTYKGLTAGMRSPHMDMHDARLGDSQRNVPAVPQKTGYRVEGWANGTVLDRCQAIS